MSAKVIHIRRPQPSRLPRWDIYRAAAKARWLGTIEAPDADTAISDAAKEFKVPDPKKLIAARRQ